MPDRRTHSQTLKDRATQLLIKFKTGALVTQLTHRWVCEAFVPAEGFGRTSKVLISITTISINELSPYRSSPPRGHFVKIFDVDGTLFYSLFDVGQALLFVLLFFLCWWIVFLPAHICKNNNGCVQRNSDRMSEQLYSVIWICVPLSLQTRTWLELFEANLVRNRSCFTTEEYQRPESIGFFGILITTAITAKTFEW